MIFIVKAIIERVNIGCSPDGEPVVVKTLIEHVEIVDRTPSNKSIGELLDRQLLQWGIYPHDEFDQVKSITIDTLDW